MCVKHVFSQRGHCNLSFGSGMFYLNLKKLNKIFHHISFLGFGGSSSCTVIVVVISLFLVNIFVICTRAGFLLPPTDRMALSMFSIEISFLLVLFLAHQAFWLRLDLSKSSQSLLGAYMDPRDLPETPLYHLRLHLQCHLFFQQ